MWVYFRRKEYICPAFLLFRWEYMHIFKFKSRRQSVGLEIMNTMKPANRDGPSLFEIIEQNFKLDIYL